MNYLFKDSELSVLRSLAEAGLLDELKEKRLFNTVHDMAIGLQRINTEGKDGSSTEVHHYYPRIALATLKDLYGAAKREHLIHFTYISNLYALGFGLPKSTKMAFAWRKWSTKSCPGPGYPQFDWALAKLRKDVKDAIAESDDGFAYYRGYKIRRDVYAQTLQPQTAVHDVPSIRKALFGKSRKRRNIDISYALKGLPCIAVYEHSMSGFRLIDVAVRYDKRIVPFLQQAFKPACDIPAILSPTDDNYAERIAGLTEAREVKRFVVSGTLCVPNNRLQECSAQGWNKLSDVFKAALAWEKRDPTPDPVKMFDFVANNIYVYDIVDNTLNTLAVRAQHKGQHLQAIGFTAMSVPGFDVYRSIYPSDTLTVNTIKQDIGKVQKRFKNYRVHAAVFEASDLPYLAKDTKRVRLEC